MLLQFVALWVVGSLPAHFDHLRRGARLFAAPVWAQSPSSVALGGGAVGAALCGLVLFPVLGTLQNAISRFLPKRPRKSKKTTSKSLSGPVKSEPPSSKQSGASASRPFEPKPKAKDKEPDKDSD